MHEIQARAEGVDVVGGGQKVTFLGEEYRIADKVGLMPLMRFAVAAKSGMESDDMEALAAMYSLIKDCIDATEWPRFERDATDKKADQDDLLKVVTDVIQVLTARPTRQPTDSSAGLPTTSPTSKGNSPSTGPSPRVPEGAGELVSITALLAAH
ncbi:hypothetical protein AB0B63_06935 [Micromonospora sp. NPDC049081]|uniref:hypothetical protein n=1 Tax=Micromonospora sp. NPDC049081 TaxID=3155150 RepID=UPI00340DE9A4